MPVVPLLDLRLEVGDEVPRGHFASLRESGSVGEGVARYLVELALLVVHAADAVYVKIIGRRGDVYMCLYALV